MRMIWLLPLCLAACGSVAAPTDRFVGSVQGCGVTTRGVLDIRGADFVFTPDEGVLSIHGHVDAAGLLHGEAVQQGTAVSGGAAATHIVFDGRRSADAVTGTVTRPGCTQTVALAPPERSFLPAGAPPDFVRKILPY